MTPDQIRQRVAAIAAVSHDPERAHFKEDRLHLDVLTAIAEGRCEDPKACAAEAIKTAGIGFDRWYA